MEYEYWTSRRKDERRAWLPFLVVGIALIALIAGLFIAFRDDGPADSTGPLPSLPDRTTTTPSTRPSTTLAPSTTARQQQPVVTPPVVVPPNRDPDDSSPPQASESPDDALRAVADQSFASTVSDIVRSGSDQYAMAVLSGDVQLLRWTGDEWQREDGVDVPFTVRAIDTVDVTDDGAEDFVIRLSGPGDPGGVFSRTTFRFELLPFNTTAGRENWVDELRLEFGRLVSDVTVSGRRVTVDWTWTGRQFEVLA